MLVYIRKLTNLDSRKDVVYPNGGTYYTMTCHFHDILTIAFLMTYNTATFYDIYYNFIMTILMTYYTATLFGHFYDIL